MKSVNFSNSNNNHIPNLVITIIHEKNIIHTCIQRLSTQHNKHCTNTPFKQQHPAIQLTHIPDILTPLLDLDLD